MATKTDNVLSDLIINDLTQEEYDALVASGEVQEGQIYATDGEGSSGGGSTTGGLESVAHDSSLEGAGTTASPLKVAGTVIAQINNKADGTVVETLSSVVSENTTKLNTLRNDTDSLGDQVSGIEEKIPSSASATNQLATKADLPIGFDATVVDQLPATGEKGIIYLVPKDGEAPDIHDEYIWIDSEQKFEFIGSTAVDLSGYLPTTGGTLTGTLTSDVPDYTNSIKLPGFYVQRRGSYALIGIGSSLTLYSGGDNDLSPYRDNSVSLGYDTRAWRNVYTAKLNNGADIAIPTEGGTMARIEDIAAIGGDGTAGQVLTKTDDGMAWQDGAKGGASLPILMRTWSDHVINDMSWLRADTFSWQSGDVYKAAYEHLTGDLDTVQKLYCWVGEKMGDKYYTYSENPSVGETTTDGEAIKSIDSYGRPVVGADYLERYPEGDMLSTQTDTIGDTTIAYCLAEDGHKICLPDQESNLIALYEATGAADYYILDTTNKQFKLPRENKDGKYLYFYVGNFTQEAIEQTAGLNAELFNSKADVSRVEVLEGYDYVVESQFPAASNGYTWYRKYKSGWIEQGGIKTDSSSTTSVTIPVVMSDTNYTVLLGDGVYSPTGSDIRVRYVSSKTTTGFTTSSISSIPFSWQVSGKAA